MRFTRPVCFLRNNMQAKGKHEDFWIQESIRDKSFGDYYTLGTELGRGTNAVVHRCEHTGTRKAWAVKIITKSKDRKVIQSDVGILLHIKHPNVIEIKEVYESPTKIYLIMELVTGGELFHRIVSRGTFSEKDAAEAMRDILNALKCIHENGIVHLDVKPENLLYESNKDHSKLKIADFALSKIIEGDLRFQTVCQTPGYLPPEVLIRTKYKNPAAVDMWSCGVIAYILLCGYEPFAGKDMYKKILKAEYKFDPPLWTNISVNAKDFISKLLQKDPSKRLSAEAALKHLWVTGTAAKGDHLNDTQEKIKEFNASRKFRALAGTVIFTARTSKLLEDRKPNVTLLLGDKRISPEKQTVEGWECGKRMVAEDHVGQVFTGRATSVNLLGGFIRW